MPIRSAVLLLSSSPESFTARDVTVVGTVVVVVTGVVSGVVEGGNVDGAAVSVKTASAICEKANFVTPSSWLETTKLMVYSLNGSSKEFR